MRIEIIGAGAVGLLMASFFIEQQADVTFVLRRQLPKEQKITRTIPTFIIQTSYRHLQLNCKNS